jgi:hypothetical protein
MGSGEWGVGSGKWEVGVGWTPERSEESSTARDEYGLDACRSQASKLIAGALGLAKTRTASR